MILDKIENAGLSLEITDAGNLRVAGWLDNKQRDYIRFNKHQLIVALRLRPIAEKYGHDLDDLLSWYRDDLDDLAAMSDKDFRFVVGEYLDNFSRYSPVNRPHTVQCVSCQHFSRSSHPHLGRCKANVPPPNCGLFWDNDSRGCDKFTESTQESAACFSGDSQEKFQ